jgi:general secretion pathway protein A
MYLEHFGITAQPFRLTPDSGFLFMSEPHSRAKTYMNYTVWSRGGFAVITGEIGSGKTTLIQKLLSELDESVVVAKVFQTQLDEVEFLQAVMLEFGLNPGNADRVELLDSLSAFLVNQFLQHRHTVLIVDEAHNLSAKVLETIRALAEVATGKEKVLHVILVGQPQLNGALERPEMEQLIQRIRLRHHIRALTEQEQGEYIRHRLSVVGGSNRTLFLPDSLPLIYKYAGGVPRLINTLCDMALTSAYADGLLEISAETVESAAKELRWPDYAQRVDKRKLRAERRAAERGTQGDQSQALAAIAARVSKLEERWPTLESVGRRLEAIETYLKDLIRSKAGAPRRDSAPDHIQKSG